MGDATPIRAPKAPSECKYRPTVRVLVVEDSLVARAVYGRLIKAEADLELVGEAGTAEKALELLETLRADVIMLDLHMPGMGGLDALPKILAKSRGAQVLVVSSLTEEGAQHTLSALSLGAADTLLKPKSGGFDQAYRQRLVDSIRALGLRIRRTAAPAEKTPALRPKASKGARVLALGASTGGIIALRQFFESLPSRIGIPIVVTQHLPVSFLPAFAEQLTRFSGRPARLAKAGMVLEEDVIIIAPGDAHLLIEARGNQLVCRLSQTASASGCMPSVDPMISSIAATCSGQCVAVVFSGMGRDGCVGAEELVKAGGSVLVQDEESCAVWGMPGTIARAGLATAILSPSKLAARILAVRKFK